MRICNALFLLHDKINRVSNPASVNVGNKYIDSKTTSSMLSNFKGAPKL